MQSIRELVSGFAYGHMEYMLALMEREGENALLGGSPCSVDASGFTDGMLLHAAVRMYLHAPTEAAKKRVAAFARRFSEEHALDTWGKLSVLEALRLLTDAGKMDILPADMLGLLIRKTDYEDFLDKETLVLKKGLPTNYYHVALACAGLREILGFDEGNMSDVIAGKMLDVIRSNSGEGWMDERPPFGRFDGYSIGMNRALASALSEIGKPVPDFLWENSRKSAEFYLANRNRAGHGFSYGRSTSLYGGATEPLRDISYALVNGMLPEERKDEAVAYCIHIVEKLINFWYRAEDRRFDMWTGGRQTDSYRGIHRVLESNLETTMRMIRLLEDFDKVGLADYVPERDLDEPVGWEVHTTEFVSEPGKVRAACVLRHGSHSFMLPFVGAAAPTYFPFPGEPFLAEAPIGRHLPMLTPELTLEDGAQVMPVQHFDGLNVSQDENGVTIRASGRCCLMDRSGKLEQVREASDIRFDIRYVFSGDEIDVRFTFDREGQAQMQYAGMTDCVRFHGFETQTVEDVSGDERFHTTHGAMKICRTGCGRGAEFGYTMHLD